MRSRPINLLLVLLLACYVLGFTGWLLTSGLRVTEEDGYYYYKVADNLAHGYGPTFDGVHWTNGFHPLWLLVLAALFRLVNRTAELPAAILIQVLLTAACTLLLYHVAQRFTGRLAACLAALLWLYWTGEWVLSGLEFSLHTLCLLALLDFYLSRFARGQPPSVSVHAALGALLALAFLARIDSLPLGFILWATLAWQMRHWSTPRERAARLIALGLPALATVGAYSAINLWLFGTPLSVSAAVKHDWGAYLLTQDPHFVAGGWWLAKLAASLWPFARLDSNLGQYISLGSYGIAVAWLAVRLLSRMARPNGWSSALSALQPFIWFSLINLLSYVLELHGALLFAAWYYVVQPLLAALLVACLCRQLAARVSLHVGLMVLLLIVPLLTLRNFASLLERQRTGALHDPMYVAAQWARANLPPDTIIGAWNAGTVGYLSERRTINLDGVVNSWSYFSRDRYDLCQYWEQNGVMVLLDTFQDGQALSVQPTLPAYARCASQLELIWSANPFNTPWQIQAYRFHPSAALSTHPP
jgi:hypothetical protein